MSPIPSETEKIGRYQAILEQLRNKIPSLSSKQEIFDYVIQLLSNLPHFQWTGIYEYEEPKQMLFLYPTYVGLPTEHIQIPKGQGVCGSAVAQDKDIIVKDVTQQENYLACSAHTKSEIVVLIKKDSHVLGQIDVDSDEISAFSDTDKTYLQQIADIIVQNLP